MTLANDTAQTAGATQDDAMAATSGAWRGAVVRRPAPTSLAYRSAKRLLDLALATTALVVLAPALLAIVVAIRIESAGSAIYRQRRVGARRLRAPADAWTPKPFTILKFRTMVADADEGVHVERIQQYVRGEHITGAGPASKPDDDPRITRVGRVLRTWSLDELPQLVNVVRGDMSLVGPRPVPAYEADAYGPEHLVRFTTRPGITGLWQVSGRSECGFRQVLDHDLDYVARQSLRLDLRILRRTVTTVTRRRGAA